MDHSRIRMFMEATNSVCLRRKRSKGTNPGRTPQLDTSQAKHTYISKKQKREGKPRTPERDASKTTTVAQGQKQGEEQANVTKTTNLKM